MYQPLCGSVRGSRESRALLNSSSLNYSIKYYMDLNRISLLGNVSNDPEQKEVGSGASVTRLNVATNHSWKDAKTGELKEKVNFHTVVAWNGLGKTMATYLKKGDRVYIEGRVDHRAVPDTSSKATRYFTDVVAQKMIMLGGKKKATTDEEPVVEEISVEDIPFNG